jgi:hypothetical protein
MTRTYDEWMRAVDAELCKLVFLPSADLPDACWMDSWEAGITAKEAAREYVEIEFSGELEFC